jgi:hypothetical protein
LINRLRPYQREVALAILDSVFGRKGITFSVEIAPGLTVAGEPLHEAGVTVCTVVLAADIGIDAVLIYL